MPKTRFRRALLPLVLLLATGAFAQAAAANSNPDAQLVTVYDFDKPLDTAYFSVCGQVPGSDGCYGGGSFTGLGHIGALMEGNPVVYADLGTVTRDVYVVDQAAGGGTSTTVNLVIYRLTTVVNGSDATITQSKIKTIALPLTGGTKAHTFMAANAGYLFIGTDQGGSAVRVSKNSYAVTNVAGFTPSIDVSAITADPYGYVDVTFGSLNGADGVHAYDPAGASLGLSHGAGFKLGTGKGLSTYGLLAHQGAAAPAIVKYHPQAAVAAAASTNPDAGLSIDYAFDPAFKTLGYEVCGSVSGSSGCYANGTVDTFGHVGAVVMGNPNVDAAHNTVRRDLFVVDDAVGGGSSTTVGLYVYRITETINAPGVAVTVAKIKSIGLGLIGGTHAKTYLAGDGSALFVGTNQSDVFAYVDKSNWSTSSAGGFSPPVHGSNATTDHYGNIVITFGGTSGEDGFYVYGPGSGGLSDGGGADFVLNTVQSMSLAEVDTSTTPFGATGPRPMHVNYHTSK